MNYNYPQYAGGYGGYKPAPQPSQWVQQTAPISQVRPVSSIEEVRACPIDFDGSVFYFADVANKRIYTKQINLDGTATINTYQLQADQIANSSYVTRQEFETAINQLKEMCNNKPVMVEEKKMENDQQPAAQQTALFSF